MIVDPDFLDHWKTVMLIDSIGETAPLCVIRLWGHCQLRKQFEFENLNPRALKAICRYKGEGQELLDALSEAQFVEHDGHVLRVVGWEEYNAKLIANWENGGKGGRPKKPTGNPPETQQKPTENPTETHAEPIRLDKTRQDKMREDMSSSRGVVGNFVDVVSEDRAKSNTNKIRQVSDGRIPLETAWKIACVDVLAETGMVADLLRKLRSGEISNPKSYCRKMLLNYCKENGFDGGLPQLDAELPPLPKRKEASCL